eukprot:CAMPEP_0195525138 /NCGR_PEP_ID=MMETSP0794_2-20130614/25397_1 /TAXON_ID=515487 /ORGANISM="Stephanopyxis turris, Strain CCMP 815" /LENGTH=292 /DNA_ID=CAMNT_0040655515 /DNA_START=101 /DNA_END=979 /DNA_ORIENTATION=+
MPAKYADLSKKAKDTLNKGFDSNNSVKVNTKASNGVGYSASISSKGNGKISGKVGAKFSHSSGFNVKKLEIANNGTLASDVTLTGAVDNVTFNLNVVMQPLALSGAGEKCTVGLDYAHDKAKVTFAVSPLLPTAASISALVQATDNILVGGSYSGELDDSWVHKSGNVGLGYSSGDSVVTLGSCSFFNKFHLNAFHQHSQDIAFAATVGLDRSNISNASVTVGGTYSVDADTTVKAKVSVPKASTDGATAAFGFNQKLNSNVRLTAASTVNLDPQDDLFGASFALGLEFGSV